MGDNAESIKNSTEIKQPSQENVSKITEIKEKLSESIKNSTEIKQPSQENVSKITEIKEKLSAEIEKIEENINEISKMKQESIEKIELKKKDLRELSGATEICQDKEETMREILIYGKDIEERKISITMLDETIASLDKQIAQIQAEHDKAIAELDLKKRKLNAKLEYYDALNKRLQELLEMIQQDSKKHEEKINDLLRQRSELLKRTDLSETTLKDMLNKLDAEIENCNKEHEFIMECFERKFSDIEITDTEIMSEFADEIAGEIEPVQLLTEEQLKEIEEFELNFYKLLHPRISSQERLALLRRGLQITPSGRIIMGDKIITLNQARLLGLLAEWQEPEEEEIVEPETIIEEEKEKKKRGFMGIITPSEISSSGVSSSIESELDQRDIEYLKHVFGKSLSLALAEIVAVQPSDPIHYLAHWFIKYRYNQEIDEVKRLEIQALMIEREKIEAERWRRELQEEAYLAVLEALFRAENIIRQQEYEKMEMMEMEGEYEEDRFNPMELFNI